MDHDRKTLELGVGSRLLFRDWLDWLFAAAVLGLSPLLWLHCQDLWFRTDLLFFPLLLLVFVALAVRVSRSAWSEAPLQCGPMRSRFAVALLIAACLAALSASLLFSPWLAWLALLLVSNAWLLVRLQDLNWYRAVGCTLPLGVFLVLPLSDAADASRTLESWTAFSASALLDLFGVPQLATHDGLELRGGLLPMAAICAGMGNPYFLFSLAVLLVMWRSRSFLVGLLTVASVPAWAWLGAVVQAVGGAALWDKQDIYLFGGGRKVVVQLAVLLALLLMIWLFHWAVQKLLSPFTAYSATFAGIHKFFNRAVLWPARDPLRRRTESSRKAPAGAGLLHHRHASRTLLVGAVLFLVAGGFILYQIVGQQAAAGLRPLRFASDKVERALQAKALPAQLGTWQQVAFEIVRRPHQRFSGEFAAAWVYLQATGRVEVTADFPYRGFYPAERNVLQPASRLLKPRRSWSLDVDSLGELTVDEVEFADPLYGLSFLCYATLPLAGSEALPRGEQDSVFRSLTESLTLQPTVASIRLQLQGLETLSDQDRQQSRKLLGEVCAQLLPVLRAGGASVE